MAWQSDRPRRRCSTGPVPTLSGRAFSGSGRQAAGQQAIVYGPLLNEWRLSPDCKGAWHALAMGYCFKVPRSSPIKLGYVRGVSVATSHVPLSIFRLCQAAKRAKVNPARGIALVRKNRCCDGDTPQGICRLPNSPKSRALTLSCRLTSGGRLLDPKADSRYRRN